MGTCRMGQLLLVLLPGSPGGARCGGAAADTWAEFPGEVCSKPPLLPYQHTSVPAGPCLVCRALFFLLGLVLRAPVLPAAGTPAASPCKSQEALGTIPKDAGKAPAKPRACHPQKAAAWGRVALGTRGHSSRSTCMSRPLPPPSATPAPAAAGEAPGARAQRPARPPGLLAAGAIRSSQNPQTGRVSTGCCSWQQRGGIQHPPAMGERGSLGASTQRCDVLKAEGP